MSTCSAPSQLPDAGTPGELIDHILTRFHDVHRQQLPELIRMAHRVEAVHRGNPDVPAGLGDALEAMRQELLTHMHKEEAILFPMLRQGGNSFVSQPIGVMRHEHNDHGAALEHLASLTHDMIPPMGACNTWRALHTGLSPAARRPDPAHPPGEQRAVPALRSGHRRRLRLFGLRLQLRPRVFAHARAGVGAGGPAMMRRQLVAQVARRRAAALGHLLAQLRQLAAGARSAAAGDTPSG